MTAADDRAVAQLHAQSWASAYRGMLRDDYLDGPVFDERLAHWQRRWTRPEPGQCGVVALDDTGLTGFAFALPSHHAGRGTLLDNLHVRPTLRGGGLGLGLIAALAAALLQAGHGGPIYLEVLEANQAARRFYHRLGAQAVPAGLATMPDGTALREWIYAWPSVATLRDAANLSSGDGPSNAGLVVRTARTHS